MAVTVDSEMASNVAANVAGATSLTYSFTNTAGTYLVVAAEINGIPQTVSLSSVTYNAVTVNKYAATEVGWDPADVNSRCRMAVYTLQSPATGANNVVVTGSVSDNLLSAAISLTGAKASAAEANGTSNFASTAVTTSPTITLSSVAASSLCLVSYAHGGAIQAGLSFSPAQTQSAFKDVDTSSAGNNLTMTRFTGSGTLTPTATCTAADQWGVSAMEILAAVSAQFPFDQRPNLVRF